MHVTGAVEGDDTTMRFDPAEFAEFELPPLHRPKFLAIVFVEYLGVDDGEEG